MTAAVKRMWVRRAFAALLLLALTACYGVPRATIGAQDPLVYSQAEVDQSDRVVIFIPGALSSVSIFEGATVWNDAGWARAVYRYPGLDGLAVDHRVSPDAAAAWIAGFANRHPYKDIALVGYSTGGPIALLAASQMTRERKISVAAMSTAVDHGGGAQTFLRGFGDVIDAAGEVGSLRKSKVWKRFWAGLLYGPDALDDPAFDDRLRVKIAEGEKIIIKLDPQVALAHTLALPGWSLPDPIDLTGVNVGVFIGLNDPVFSLSQTQRFVRRIGDVPVYGYPDQGHLLFFTRPEVFADMLEFAQTGRVSRASPPTDQFPASSGNAAHQ